MTTKTYLTTPRLLLRGWSEADAEPFAAMNADPRVMEYFPNPLSFDESEALRRRCMAELEAEGFGPYAVERRSDGAFLGFVGLHRVKFEADFTPAVEIGWRLRADAWGHGYACEAARAVLDDAFGRLGLARVVAFAAVGNLRSQRVMERIGMRRTEEFDHPALAADHPLSRHALYAADRPLRFELKAFGELDVAELHALTMLRERVFFLEQHITQPDADAVDLRSLFLWHTEADEAVGVLRVIPPGTVGPEASIGRVAVDARWRRRGICRAMVRRALDEIGRRWPGVAVRISAQSYLTAFYEEMGFEACSDEYLEAGLSHRSMRLRR